MCRATHDTCRAERRKIAPPRGQSSLITRRWCCFKVVSVRAFLRPLCASVSLCEYQRPWHHETSPLARTELRRTFLFNTETQRHRGTEGTEGSQAGSAVGSPISRHCQYGRANPWSPGSVTRVDAAARRERSNSQANSSKSRSNSSKSRPDSSKSRPETANSRGDTGKAGSGHAEITKRHVEITIRHRASECQVVISGCPVVVSGCQVVLLGCRVVNPRCRVVILRCRVVMRKVSGRDFAVSGRDFAVSGRDFAVSGRDFAVSIDDSEVSGRALETWPRRANVAKGDARLKCSRDRP